MLPAATYHVSRRVLPRSFGAILSSSSDSILTMRHRHPRVSFSTQQEYVVPPNLSFDPRSSFAPVRNNDDDFDDGFYSDDDGIEGSVGDEDTLDEDMLEEAYDSEVHLSRPETIYAIPLPERLHVDIHSLQPGIDSSSSIVGSIHLDSSVFGLRDIRVDLMKRAVDYYRSKARGRRKAVTKTIGQVSGSGRKLRPQKGGGTARVGHSRPPHFRGGAKAHGPKNITDYGNVKMNRKMRRQALKSALSQKLYEGNLVILNELVDSSHKTKDLSRLLSTFNIGGKSGDSALILDHYIDDNDGDDDGSKTKTASFHGVPAPFYVAAQNIPKLTVGSHHLASVYQILKHEKLVLTLAAIEQLESRP